MECDIVGPHLNSFNWLLEDGFDAAVQDLPPFEAETNDGRRLSIEISNPVVGYPSLSGEGQTVSSVKLYPIEVFPQCRQRGLTYKARVTASINLALDGVMVDKLESVTIGEIPIMVKSKRCHLQNFTPKQLIAKGEEESELGGYFIIGGLEKIVRLHIVPRRNFALFDCPDRFLYETLIRGKEHDEFWKG
ncbi:unnamed protein product [Soboliphyme baturini]|uniref:DNA-directed RNA polymerase n=1 Tax=Soboliphyme baturini TaxID=241478 RepID=A0A183IV44_9BILA|nr:unnamed protein product [Soboliphyme baturini]